VSWTLHTVPPIVTITGGPANHAITSLQTAVITFDANDLLPYTSVCSLDSANFTDCTSAQTNYTVSGLSEGSHSFRVQSTDAAGNASPVVSLVWTVDLSVPTVTILQRPSVISNSPVANFKFQGAIASTVSRCSACAFACALDGARAQPCAQAPSVVTYSALSEGAHNFSVTVTDPDGNLRTVTAASWLVDLRPPNVTITASPLVRTVSDAAVFAFAASDNYDVSCASCTFTCQLDAFLPQACTPALGAKYAGLGLGGRTASHVFAIVATDQVSQASELDPDRSISFFANVEKHVGLG
jgi:hypothetical protein